MPVGETGARRRRWDVMRGSTFLAGVLLPFALAACSDPAPDTAQEAAPAAAPPAGSAEAASAMADMLNLAVQELTPLHIEQANLAGELACSFAPGPGGELLFLGRGDVGAAAGAQGLISLPDGVRKLAMDGVGGYDAMARGARFTGEDVGVEIALGDPGEGGEELQVAEESPALPATMTVRSASSEIAVQGVYRCGP